MSTISMKKGDSQVTYLISKPIKVPISAIGRTTRGYWAFQIQDKELCFLKDTWRKDAGAEHEGSICQELYQAGVPNVPEIECYSDVLQRCSADAQRTSTQDFISAPWVKRALSKEYLQSTIVPRVHHRLVSKTVGLGLGEHKDMRELLGFARDMFDTALAAYEKCGRLHRDISAGNVILVRDPKTNKRTAFTINWEFSVSQNELQGKTPHTVSGTRPFMSWRLLSGYDEAPHRLDDDLESILWVIYWHLLVYYSNPNTSTEELARTLREVFDSSTQAAYFATKALCLGQSERLLKGLTAHVGLHQWLLGYAEYLYARSLARKNPQIEGNVPSLVAFRKETLNLVDKYPFSAAPKEPDWNGLRAYFARGQTPFFPATFSTGSEDSSPIWQTPCPATMPAPFEADQEATWIRNQAYRKRGGDDDIEELDEQGDKGGESGWHAKRARIRSGSPSH